MPIDVEIVRKIANLAKLTLTPEEELHYATQLEKIVTYFEQLKEIDTSNVKPLAHVHEITNVMREDEIKPSLPPEEIFKNAPSHKYGYFIVPKVIKGNNK